MNYPNKKNSDTNSFINYAHRGMTLESDINSSNKYYLENDIALIYKKPTPIKVVKVNYERNKITEGYYEVPSTTDYNGVYKGRYIDFEAKETKSKTSFSLVNLSISSRANSFNSSSLSINLASSKSFITFLYL